MCEFFECDYCMLLCEFFGCDYCILLTVTVITPEKFIHKFYYYVNFSGVITVYYLQ